MPHVTERGLASSKRPMEERFRISAGLTGSDRGVLPRDRSPWDCSSVPGGLDVSLR